MRKKSERATRAVDALTKVVEGDKVTLRYHTPMGEDAYYEVCVETGRARFYSGKSLVEALARMAEGEPRC